MANWKTYMANHFGSCLVLAHARDNCRQRDVKICAIPGEVEAVGITDGTDAWIAPVTADCFSVNVRRLMDDLHAGKFVRAEAYAPRRERKQPITMMTEAPPCKDISDDFGKSQVSLRTRAALLSDASPAAAPENATRRRRVL